MAQYWSSLLSLLSLHPKYLDVPKSKDLGLIAALRSPHLQKIRNM
jgi:hypothetical protein